MKIRHGLALTAAAGASAPYHRELSAATDDHADETCHDRHYPCSALAHACEESCARHTFTLHYCEEACHVCASHGCMEAWFEEDNAGAHGDREYYYVDSICALFLMATTLLFEKVIHVMHQKSHKLTPLSIDAHKESEIQDKIGMLLHRRERPAYETSRRNLKETRAARANRKHAAELKHIEHGIGKRRNYVEELVHRGEAELAVLGFISFALFVAHAFEVSHAVARRTKDSKWFPQTHSQLDHVVHVAHVALFLGMVLYFLILYVAARLAVHANQRFLQHASHLATQRAGGVVEETKALRWYATLRDRFIFVVKTGVPEVEDDFPFQLYLRLYQDDVLHELIVPKDSTWALAMALHAAEALVCRFGSGHQLIGYVEAGLNTVILLLAAFTFYILFGEKGLTRNWRMGVETESFIVRSLQSLVLCNSYRFARAVLHGTLAWYNVYVVLTIVLICPLLVVFGNILLRVPPFVDEMDFEVIGAVAAFKARVAGDAPPSEINFMRDDSMGAKVAPE